MERPAPGETVILPFPFADQLAFKYRPVLGIAMWKLALGRECLVAMITSKPSVDAPVVELAASDFIRGGLSTISDIRPW